MQGRVLFLCQDSMLCDLGKLLNLSELWHHPLEC